MIRGTLFFNQYYLRTHVIKRADRQIEGWDNLQTNRRPEQLVKKGTRVKVGQVTGVCKHVLVRVARDVSRLGCLLLGH